MSINNKLALMRARMIREAEEFLGRYLQWPARVIFRRPSGLRRSTPVSSGLSSPATADEAPESEDSTARTSAC